MLRTIRVSCLLVIVCAPVASQVPEKINWQGYLTDTGGQPIDGMVNLIISLYDVATGGTALYAKDTTNVVADNGVVNVPLGPFPAVTFDGPLFLGLRVNGGAEGEPRAPLGSVPYAHRAIAVAGFRGEPASNETYEGANVIAGASNNTIAHGVVGGTIAGGGGVEGSTARPNLVTADYGSIGGGHYNDATGPFATIGGGRLNSAGDYNATVGGGYRNWAKSVSSSIGGGSENTASGFNATVGGGHKNTASGFYATVGGGEDNTAEGYWSFAAGRSAQALHRGAFVWADSYTSTSFQSTAENQFAIRANGGVVLAGTAPNDDARIYSDPAQSGSDLWLHGNDAVVAQIDRNNNGQGNFFVQNGTPEFVFQVTRSGQVYVKGTSVHGSDRNQKEGIQPVEPAAVLEGVLSLPISRWRYIGDDATRLGPMAQDFAAAFGLGTDDTTIAAVDADGVALAAIQGLYQRLLDERRRNDSLEERLATLEREVAATR